jgi:putative spermidine/putrescine transport system permease protein
MAREAVASTVAPAGRPVRPAGASRATLVGWLGVIPFFAYAALFLLLPTVVLVIKSFEGSDGSFTLANVSALFEPQYRSAFVQSIELSTITAVGGGLLGLLVAYAAIHGRVSRWVRPALATFSGVAANFAGIPLAFAFVATIGPVGVITAVLNGMGLHLYDGLHFSIFGMTGLSLTYIYFQFPLMILIISPSLEGLRTEWREAAENLGASPAQYWRHIGFPVLLPALLGAMVLLFGNAFSAYATAVALSGGSINLVAVLIGALVSGNVSASNPQFADALSLGMIVIVAVTVVAYIVLQRRTARWLT